jgi:hypothetical protein
MSGTQVDARIPLMARPPQPATGSNFGDSLQIAAQMDALRAEQQKEQRQNALRSILGKEGTIDTNGMVTPDALRQIGSVDQDAFLKVHQNNLVTQQRKLQYDTLRSDAYFKQASYLNDQYAPIYQQYEEGVKKGEIPEPDLRKQAEQSVQETTKRVREGGFVGPEVGNTLPSGFDPVEMKRRAMQSREYLDWVKEQRRREEDAAKEKHAAAREERQGWVTMDDLGKKDDQGNPTQYRYNPQTGAATSLDGKIPYAPVRGTKVGTEKTAPPGSLASRMVAIESDVNNDPEWKDKKPGERAMEVTRRYEVAKADANAIPDDTATTIAEQAWAGDWSGTVGMGRDAASRRKIANKITELGKTNGRTGAELAAKKAEFQGIVAAERMLGVRGAGIEVGIAEAKRFAPMVLELSEKLDRTQFPTVNSLLLASERGTGGEDVVRMIDALNAYKMAYTQILTRGGMPTDDARKRSDEIINIAWSKGQIKASIDQLGKEMEAADSAVPDVRAKLWNTITGKPVAEYPGRPAEKQGADKGAAQTAPAIPAPLQKMFDAGRLWSNPDRTMFVDKGDEKGVGKGTYYDRSGKKIAPPQAPAAIAPAAPVGSTPPSAPVQIPPAPAPAGPRAALPADEPSVAPASQPQSKGTVAAPLSVPPNPTPDKLIDGGIYETKKGPLRWDKAAQQFVRPEAQ